MAEPIGVASAVLTLATFALQSSVALYETVKSFKSHLQRVQDLLEELDALGVVLASLREAASALPDVDFSTLKSPLERCGNACKEFEKELLKCVSRSSHKGTSFRDWAKLTYMREDIDGFRRLLAGYKLTINVALADANLRKSSATAERVETYNDLLATARADLEDHVERIDEKVELILAQNAAQSESDGAELQLMKEERLSTEKCLQICAQLSEHISQIQLTASLTSSHSESLDSDSVSERITNDGLQECKMGLARTARKLEEHQKQIFSRLIDNSKTAIASEEDRADLVRLRDEWEATRQGMEVCSTAHDHLKDDVSSIDNYATGDAVQFMVSTGKKTIHGKNRGLGWRTRQVGGHLSDDSLQQLAQSLVSIAIPSTGPRDRPPQGDTPFAPHEGPETEHDSKFKERHGKGVKLVSKSIPGTHTSPARPAEGGSSNNRTG